MGLKNIFKMTKTDRYTQDGREEIAKLQETEDVTYKTGDISQKTGLQKQPDGSWAPPKKGGAGAKKAAGSKKIDYQVTEKGGKFYATGHQFSDGSQLHAGPFGSEKELHEFMNGSPYKSTAESKPAGNKAAAGSTQSKADRNAKLYEGGIKELVEHAWNTRENWTEEELQKEYDLDKTDAKAVKEKLDRLANPQKADNSDLYELETESKPEESPESDNEIMNYEEAEKAIDEGKIVQWEHRDGKWHDIDPKTSALVQARDIGAKFRIKTDEDGNPIAQKPEPSQNELRSKLVELEKRRKKFEKYPDMDNNIRLQQGALLNRAGFESRAEFEDFIKSEMPTDSAPRELTGDCRIRIRKEKPKLTGDTKIRIRK